MKYLKTYENDNKPEKGDYVICKEILLSNKESYKLNIFLKNNIGKIVDFDNVYDYYVMYKVDDEQLASNFFDPYIKSKKLYARLFSDIEILHYAKNIEDLKIYLATKKYNI